MLYAAAIVLLWFAGIAAFLGCDRLAKRREEWLLAQRMREYWKRQRAEFRDEVGCLDQRYWRALGVDERIEVAQSWLDFCETLKLCGIDRSDYRSIQEVAGYYYVAAVKDHERKCRGK